MTAASASASADLVSRLAGRRIAVLGDVIVDHYIHGPSERVSPEAPVPVVVFQSEAWLAGGAANVARNITALGGLARLAGAFGRDEGGERLRAALAASGVDPGDLVVCGARPTTLKTRIVSSHQQMLRVDREDARPLAGADEDAAVAAVRTVLAGAEAVILSDYAKGFLTERVLTEVMELARAAGIPVLVDPKGRRYARYRGATFLTPNLRETAEASGMPVRDEEELACAAEAVAAEAVCENLVVTRGPDGVALFSRGGDPVFIRAAAREVFDVTGAGDTFVAVLAMGVASGLTGAEAARLANTAAGVVVGKSGVAVVAPDELRLALAPTAAARKVRSPEELAELGVKLRADGKRIVFTNGCFDFIHAGHVALLQSARALGDVLVLATNTDATIQQLKGAPRPIIPQAQRIELLSAIEAVDYIVPFPDATPHRLLELLRPHLLVKGSNYRNDEVEGREVVLGQGGEVRLLDVLADISTAELIGRHGPAKG